MFQSLGRIGSVESRNSHSTGPEFSAEMRFDAVHTYAYKYKYLYSPYIHTLYLIFLSEVCTYVSFFSSLCREVLQVPLALIWANSRIFAQIFKQQSLTEQAGQKKREKKYWGSGGGGLLFFPY